MATPLHTPTDFMGHTHIITIQHDALTDHLREGDRDRDDRCLELGQKITSLCEAHANPLFPSDDSKTSEIGDCVGAIAWRGFPDTAHDELFYWGADLKPLRALNDAQLALAEKLLKRERDRRSDKPCS